MSIIRVKRKRNPYVQIDKTPLLDKQLSWKARGLMAFLMTKPDDWSVYVADLVKQSDRDGKESVQSGLKELQQVGYVLKLRSKGENGRFDGWETIVFETLEDRKAWEDANPSYSPKTGKPVVGETPKAEKPTTGKPYDGKTENGKPSHLVINEDQLINDSLVINEETKEPSHFSLSDASLPEPEVAETLTTRPVNQEDSSAPSNTGLETKSSAAANFSEKEKVELTHAQMIDQTSARYAYPECKWGEIYDLYKMGLGHLWIGPDRLTDWHPALMAGATAHKVKVQQDSTPAAVQQYIRNLIFKKLDADLEARFNEGLAIEARKRENAATISSPPSASEIPPGYYPIDQPIDLEQARRGKQIALAAMQRYREEQQRAGA